MGIMAPQAIVPAMSACMISLAMLALADFGTIMITSQGVSAGWIYNSGSVAVAKRQTLGDSNSSYVHLTGGMFTHASQHHDIYLQSIFEKHAPHVMPNVTVAAPLFSNHSGRMEHLGYMITHKTGNLVHTAIGGVGSALDMIEAAGRFEGHTWTPGKSTRIVTNATDYGKFDRRDTSTAWVSYTDWGTNVGYDKDMADWNEYTRAAQEHAYDDPLQMVEHISECAGQQQCYAVRSKSCLTMGMSPNRGHDDVLSGEIYYGAYGGLDGDCTQG